MTKWFEFTIVLEAEELIDAANLQAQIIEMIGEWEYRATSTIIEERQRPPDWGVNDEEDEYDDEHAETYG